MWRQDVREDLELYDNILTGMYSKPNMSDTYPAAFFVQNQVLYCVPVDTKSPFTPSVSVNVALTLG